MASDRRSCKNDPDNFCYICGQIIILPKQKRPITEAVKQNFKKYFNVKLGDQDKPWAPHTVCLNCTVRLSAWARGEDRSMPFATPMVWREQINHNSDCYFCLTDTFGFNMKNKHDIKYPDVRSVTKPVLHSKELPVPECSQETTSQETLASGSECDPDFFLEDVPSQVFLKQNQLNDLVRDLNLSKQNAELLGSRLQEWNFLDKSTSITYRNRNNELKKYFESVATMCICKDIFGLTTEMGIRYTTDDWRLFIDSSKSGLKAVLLHNGNQYPSIPLGYAVDLKETYDTMKTLLRNIKYNDYGWKLCCDLKVVGLLLGLQGGFTKFCCFLCLWDSRDTKNHYEKKKWPERKHYSPGQQNVQHEPLVSSEKIILPPLHIKLGMIKQFVKALPVEGPAFDRLREIFPKISEAKLREGVFDGPQIRKLCRDDIFENKLENIERNAFVSFKEVVGSFLGNRRDHNYKVIVERLIGNYKEMGCRMSLKLHFLHSHLDFFPTCSLGAVSDEQGERFHQDVQVMEERYQGRWSASFLSDFCWMSMKETDENSYKRRAKRPYLSSSRDTFTTKKV